MMDPKKGSCLELNQILVRHTIYSITVQEVQDAVMKQKKGKACGPDGIAMEAFMFACPQFYIHRSLLFNLFILHCHIPPLSMQSVIVPLVKSKGGDLTDVNN